MVAFLEGAYPVTGDPKRYSAKNLTSIPLSRVEFNPWAREKIRGYFSGPNPAFSISSPPHLLPLHREAFLAPIFLLCGGSPTLRLLAPFHAGEGVRPQW